MSSVESEEKKERCRFQISIKLEKTDVSDERSNRGFGESSEAIIGVRKCCQVLLIGKLSGHDQRGDAPNILTQGRPNKPSLSQKTLR